MPEPCGYCGDPATHAATDSLWQRCDRCERRAKHQTKSNFVPQLTYREIKKYRNVARDQGTLRRNQFKSVRNHLRNLGCTEPEATWIARDACGKKTR